MQWRCHDCFGEPVFCTTCIQERHSSHPFHRVSRWDGTCFIRSSLSKAGLTLNLGHNGHLCPRYILQVQKSGLKTPVTARQPSMAEETGGSDQDCRLSPPHFPAGSTHTFTAVDQSHTDTGNARRPADEIDMFFSSLPSTPSSYNVRFGEANDTSMYGSSPAQHILQSPFLPVRPTNQTQYSRNLDSSEPSTPVTLTGNVDSTPLVFGTIDTTVDPFFANESEDEDEWKSVETGGVPLKPTRGNRRLDSLQCPILTVVDLSGVHELRTRFCRCHDLKDNPLHKQLLAMGLYPASTERTRTVFTFRVLDHFDLSNLEGKIPSYKYYEILKRMTSNAFPNMVPDRYRELMRCLRQWRDLQARRRAGYPFDGETPPKPGSLALFCPACPQPGVNLPDDWKSDPQQYVSLHEENDNYNLHSAVI